MKKVLYAVLNSKLINLSFGLYQAQSLKDFSHETERYASRIFFLFKPEVLQRSLVIASRCSVLATLHILFSKVADSLVVFSQRAGNTL
jgi:hypothetical protein